MKFTKWIDGPWMYLVNPHLAWYYNTHGVLLHTKVARRKADRGAWIEVA